MRTTQTIFTRLLLTLPEGRIINIHMGLYWPAVLAKADGETHCGFAATVGDESQHYTTEPSVSRAGYLIELSSSELSNFVYSNEPSLLKSNKKGISNETFFSLHRPGPVSDGLRSAGNRHPCA